MHFEVKTVFYGQHTVRSETLLSLCLGHAIGIYSFEQVTSALCLSFFMGKMEIIILSHPPYTCVASTYYTEFQQKQYYIYAVLIYLIVGVGTAYILLHIFSTN